MRPASGRGLAMHDDEDIERTEALRALWARWTAPWSQDEADGRRPLVAQIHDTIPMGTRVIFFDSSKTRREGVVVGVQWMPAFVVDIGPGMHRSAWAFRLLPEHGGCILKGRTDG